MVQNGVRVVTFSDNTVSTGYLALCLTCWATRHPGSREPAKSTKRTLAASTAMLRGRSAGRTLAGLLACAGPAGPERNSPKWLPQRAVVGVGGAGRQPRRARRAAFEATDHRSIEGTAVRRPQRHADHELLSGEVGRPGRASRATRRAKSGCASSGPHTASDEASMRPTGRAKPGARRDSNINRRNGGRGCTRCQACRRAREAREHALGSPSDAGRDGHAWRDTASTSCRATARPLPRAAPV